MAKTENKGSKASTCFLAAALLFMLAGCAPENDQVTTDEPAQPAPAITYPHAGDLRIVTGQRLYVPAYSAVHGPVDNQTWEMTVTLSIRNTNLEKPIFITAVKYYDTTGQLVTDYVEAPLSLAPMATTEYIIPRQDTRGGTGSNFIVEWGAEEPVYAPVVEAVMISSGNKGVSLLSPARVLEEIR